MDVERMPEHWVHWQLQDSGLHYERDGSLWRFWERDMLWLDILFINKFIHKSTNMGITGNLYPMQHQKWKTLQPSGGLRQNGKKHHDGAGYKIFIGHKHNKFLMLFNHWKDIFFCFYFIGIAYNNLNTQPIQFDLFKWLTVWYKKTHWFLFLRKILKNDTKFHLEKSNVQE